MYQTYKSNVLVDFIHHRYLVSWHYRPQSKIFGEKTYMIYI